MTLGSARPPFSRLALAYSPTSSHFELPLLTDRHERLTKHLTMTPDRTVSLVAVRETLRKISSRQSSLFLSLVDNGKNRAYACKPSSRAVFGESETDFPGLGRKMSPYEIPNLPSLEELQTLLIKDHEATRQESSGIERDALRPFDIAEFEDEGVEMLHRLVDPDFDTDGIIMSFPSPSLEEICGDTKVLYDSELRESTSLATVLSRNSLLDIQHTSEGTTFTTLLSGAVAWVIWPPTKHNLAILESHYKATAEGMEDVQMNVMHKLEDGVCLVQTVGDAIRIPPFCLITCLSTETSVMSTYTVLTATQLADMLGKLPLLLAWFKTEVDSERKKHEFVTAMLAHLSAILRGSFESSNLRKHTYPYCEEGPLRSLLHTWDEIKHVVPTVLEPAQAEHVLNMWGNFLRAAKGRHCWICGKSIHNKLKYMRKHFETQHWLEDRAPINTQDTTQDGADMPSIVVTAPTEPDDSSSLDAREVEQPHGEVTAESDGEVVADPGVRP